MKNNTITAFYLLLVVGCTFHAIGQTTSKNEIKVQNRTLMGQFEPDYVIPIQERIELKEKRIAKQRFTKSVLDTLDITDRKRRKLMRELRKSPFSERIDRVILAETKFEDDVENENDLQQIP